MGLCSLCCHLLCCCCFEDNDDYLRDRYGPNSHRERNRHINNDTPELNRYRQQRSAAQAARRQLRLDLEAQGRQPIFDELWDVHPDPPRPGRIDRERYQDGLSRDGRMIRGKCSRVESRRLRYETERARVRGEQLGDQRTRYGGRAGGGEEGGGIEEGRRRRRHPLPGQAGGSERGGSDDESTVRGGSGMFNVEREGEAPRAPAEHQGPPSSGRVSPLPDGDEEQPGPVQPPSGPVRLRPIA